MFIKKIAAMIIIAITFLAFASLSIANSQVSPEVSATVKNAAPEILYKFELPDDDPTEEGTQVVPFSSCNFCKCECDFECHKTVYKYAVVYDANGADDIQNVHVKTYYPCGSLKSESDAVMVADPANISSALYDAVSAGLISSDEKDDILNMINSNIAKLYVEENKMWCCNPKGNYTVNVTATDNCGESDTMENTFEYMEAVLLILDFCEVDYGTVTPCEEKWVYGDKCLCTEDEPTIKALTSAPAVDIIISATPMDRGGEGGIIPATALDAELKGEAHYLNEIGVKFHDVQPCCRTALNFSLHAPPGTPAGDYTGTITITAVPS